MKFLEAVSVNPKIQLVKGNLYPFVEMEVVSTERDIHSFAYKEYTSGVKFEQGDTIVARITPCLQNGKGFYCQNIEQGFGSTEFLVFRPLNETVDSLFLYYYMRTNYIRQKMIKSMKGADGRQRVNNAVFNDLVFPNYNLNTQKRIADILSAYDDLIENNQKQIKLLEEVAQRIYKEWFVDLHFPGYENTPVVDDVPHGWKNDTIDSKIELLSGYAFKSNDFCDDGKYKIITIKNVKDGQFDGDSVSRLAEIPSKMPKHCYLLDGDILLSLTGNVGRVCMVYGEDFLLNQRVAKLKSEMPAYAYCLFRSKDMFDEMNNLANGAAQQNLSPIRTGKILHSFPTDELIHKFEEIVFPMIKNIVTLNKSNNELAAARDRLLPKLMSGELEV